MISARRANERGYEDHGWAQTRYCFSYGDYYDARHTGFRALAAINEDIVQPEHGWPMHDHDNAEIISFVLDGELAHGDSLGNEGIIRPGMVQLFGAGAGAEHRQFANEQGLHFLQIALLPHSLDLPPSYEQRYYPLADRDGKLCLIASPDGSAGSITIRQDVRLYSAILAPGGQVEHRLAHGRYAWVQVASGQVQLGNQVLTAGDGAAVSDLPTIHLTASAAAQVLVFDLA
jgi:quercetin 2,3-dioxygenase